MTIKKNKAKRNYEIVAGADVDKDKIDVSIYGEKSLIFDNTEAGIAKRIKLLKKAKAELVVLEPTGGHELELMDQTVRCGDPVLPLPSAPVSQLRPLQRNHMAKTDRLDAKLLAEYGLERSPKPTPLPDPLLASIEARMKRRQQLVRSGRVRRTGGCANWTSS